MYVFRRVRNADHIVYLRLTDKYLVREYFFPAKFMVIACLLASETVCDASGNFFGWIDPSLKVERV